VFREEAFEILQALRLDRICTRGQPGIPVTALPLLATSAGTRIVSSRLGSAKGRHA
jgi:hypothetical protein